MSTYVLIFFKSNANRATGSQCKADKGTGEGFNKTKSNVDTKLKLRSEQLSQIVTLILLFMLTV